MDGSFVEVRGVAELHHGVAAANSWIEVRAAVRAWAAKYQYLPAVTVPLYNGLRIAYHDVERGCLQISLKIPTDTLTKYHTEFDAGRGDW